MELTLLRLRLRRKLILIYLLNLADWINTVHLLKSGRFYEANPIMRQFITTIPAGFLIKCLFPAAAVYAISIALRLLDTYESAVADQFISFALVFYLCIGLDHIVNILLLIFQISP